MEQKKGYALPIAILAVLIVFVVTYISCEIYGQVRVQQGKYQFNRMIERNRNLKPGSYNVDDFNELNKEERRKYFNERKLKQ